MFEDDALMQTSQYLQHEILQSLCGKAERNLLRCSILTLHVSSQTQTRSSMLSVNMPYGNGSSHAAEA